MDYPEHRRRLRFKDPESGQTLIVLTNNTRLPALTSGGRYQCRWQVALCCKWITQQPRIKRFYGTSANAVNTPIWIAVSVYVRVASVKKELQLEASRYTLRPILSVTRFEKMPAAHAFQGSDYNSEHAPSFNQLNLSPS